MSASKSCKDTLKNKEECHKVPDSEYAETTTEVRAGGCVSLPCAGAQNDCSSVTWLFIKDRKAEPLVDRGKVTNDHVERLCVTEECSLVIKKMGKIDEGDYTCRQYSPSGRYIDQARYDLKLITGPTHTSRSKPSTTVPKGTTHTSTSNPTVADHTVKAVTWGPGVLLHVAVLLGFSVLTLVVLLRLVGWWRTRGNKMAAEECMQYTVDQDLDEAPGGPSVVQWGEQGPVGSAQDQAGPGESGQADIYENSRARPTCVGNTRGPPTCVGNSRARPTCVGNTRGPPTCVGNSRGPPTCVRDTADAGVHFVSVHRR
ncbi:hypothetical protein NHX12_007950 [Muraenolepis orangiensis]|uniref:Ig-like domain-containing protein n=1 Tax=Muraenolepis orangiensis TaxID=630683 RepID=A0A9Q0I9Q8_9TELE|nr:hypothetical protein NHX12_007950 [Muraenolepis orangiensis]